MTIPEPPYSADDTQPNFQVSRTTIRRLAPQRRILPNWILLVLMLLSATSLLATASLWWNTQAAASRPLWRIQLTVAGESRELTTSARTVAALLREQAIRLSDEDAISVAVDTPLSNGMLINIDRARDVRLIVNDTERRIRTPLTHPAAILHNQGISYDASDQIWLDGTLTTLDNLATWPIPVQEIDVQHSVALLLLDGDEPQYLQTTADTVGEALFEAGIDLYLTDIIEPDLGEPVREGLQIRIDRALPVTIRVDDTDLETRVQGDTVLDALTEAGIVLTGLDYAIPAEGDHVQPGMTIQVLRVSEEVLTEETSIPYETSYQADASLELDQRAVVQAGQAGIRRNSERVRYENGVEVGREPAGSEVVQQPIQEIVAYGTNIVLRPIETPEGVRNYWRKLRVYATSYHPEALGGDNITALGMELRKGIIGGNPDVIPYRTELYVPGYGTGIMADTGGVRSSPYWIDLGYSDEDWVGWHNYVDVYLLEPIPTQIDYLLPAWRPMRGIPDAG